VGKPKPKSPQKNAPTYSKTSRTTKTKIPLPNKACVTLWPYQLHKKNILRQKKNYGNSNISPCKNIMIKKSSKKIDILQILGK
jgi:hypothetical protein